MDSSDFQTHGVIRYYHNGEAKAITAFPFLTLDINNSDI